MYIKQADIVTKQYLRQSNPFVRLIINLKQEKIVKNGGAIR